LPELEIRADRVGAQLQAGSARAARQLQIVMLVGLLIAALLVLLIVLLLNARSKQERDSGKHASRRSTFCAR
jgi:heme A synthase